MMSWIQVSSILCAFGLMREIRPSEPFVTEFLLGEWRNVTDDQLNREVYPIGTYSYLSLLVVVFLITDFLRFKPVIILSGLSGITVYTILLWTSSMAWLQASQFFYGLYMATEVAYLTYIYAKVLATFWAFWLPTVQFSIYFHRNETITSPEQKQLEPPLKENRSFCSELIEASTLIARHAKAAYTRPKVIVWSALYACALALFVQAQTYMQLLWIQLQDYDKEAVAYNGAVEAAQTLLGAGFAYLASVYSSGVIPAPVAAVQGVAMFLGTYLYNVFGSYAGYIVMGCLFHYTITLASAQIAGQLSDESCFGLIFGINTLIGTGLQSIITAVMVQGMQLDIFAQYYVISALFGVLALVWFFGWIVHTLRQKRTVNIHN